MNINHSVPSRDALRTLSTLALGTSIRSTCVSRGRNYCSTTSKAWCRYALCTGSTSQSELSKKGKQCPRSWNIQSRRQKYSSLAVAHETYETSNQDSLASSVHSDDFLQEKTVTSKAATRVQNGSSEIASKACTSPDPDKPSSSTRNRTMGKNQSHKADARVEKQPPADLSEMKVAVKAAKRYSKTEVYIPPPFLSLKDPIPAVAQNFRFKFITEPLTEVEAQRYFYICNYFLQQIDLTSLRTATERLCKYLKLYVLSSEEEDWRLVKILHRTWSQNFASARQYRLWEPLIEASLSKPKLNLETVSMLYVRDQKSDMISSLPAEFYLQTFCQETSNTDTRLEETSKILDGTKLCGIPLSKRLLYPLITSVAKDENPDLALQMLDDMIEKYELTPDVHLLNTIATGYVNCQNWLGFESLLSNKLSADVGVGRYKPITFNVLLRTGLRGYAEHNSAEEVFDFITRHIQNYAIIPDDQLLDMTLQILCKAKRYDLVQKWNRWKKGRFPLLYTNSSTAIFAFNLSVSWRTSRASCSDIHNTCLALASGEIQDPFPVHLRFIVEELVFLDLRRRYARLKKALGEKLTSNFPSENWRLMFVEARQLIQSIKWVPKSERAKLLAQDLEKQLEAVKSLLRLFAGQNSMAAVAVHPTAKPNVQDTEIAIMRGKTRPQEWPASLRDLHLFLRYKDLVNDVSRFYEQQEIRNTKPDYRLMLHVASRLASEDRLSDAYNFMQYLYESKWRKQEVWTTEVYTKWLEVASNWRSPTAVRRVLWTIIEAPEYIRINNTLSVLVQIAQQRTHSAIFSEKVSINEHEKEEMNYLVRRLLRRHWMQSGCPSPADIEAIRFPAWSLIPVDVEL